MLKLEEGQSYLLSRQGSRSVAAAPCLPLRITRSAEGSGKHQTRGPSPGFDKDTCVVDMTLPSPRDSKTPLSGCARHCTH